MPTIAADIVKRSDPVAAHLKVAMVAGFASAAGNGSAAITGLSAASDAPIAAFYFGGTGGGHASIAIGSVTFKSNRVKITNTSTTNKAVQLFWWDEK